MARIALWGIVSLMLLWPFDQAWAACATTGTNQTCTNSDIISGPNFGIFDLQTLTLTNTVTGQISGAGAGGVLSNNAANVTNSGTISGGTFGIDSNVVNVTNSGTISANFGVVGNSGVVINSGTIIGLNSGIAGGSNGMTIINSGTIEGGAFAIDIFFGDLTNSGVIKGTVCCVNTLTIEPGYSFSAGVGGVGGSTFQLGGTGSGTLDLGTIGTQYTGFSVFNVVSGIWNTTGTFGQSQTWNVNGGVLAGTGTFQSVNVNSGGTLEPGMPGMPGTSMTIAGNLAFQSGAVYLVNLSPSNAASANVGGTASLAGTAEILLAPGGYSNKSYDILHANGGLGGTMFGGLSLGNPNYNGNLSYSATDVFLNLTAMLGSGTTLNQNQQNVATGLNNFFNSGGTLLPNFGNIFGLTGSSLANALSQLDGEVAANAEFGAFRMMTQFLGLMLDPFVDGRLGSGAGIGSRQGLGFAPGVQETLPPDIALAYASILTKAPPPAPFAQRWSVWGSAYGGSSSTNGNTIVGSSDLTARTLGFAGGMDYHYSPDTIFGFALGGGDLNWGLANGLGTGRSDVFQTGVYGITRSGPAYLSASLAFANHGMTTNRVALGDQLTANFDAQSYGGRIEGGYRFAVMPVSGVMVGISPYAALQAQVFHSPNYSEFDQTGGGFGLSYNAMNGTDTRTELGSRFDDPTVIGRMPLILRARIAWAHDFVSSPSLGAVFQSLPGAGFTVNGAPIPQNSALASAGAELFLTPRLTFLAKFDGEFANGSQTYGGSGTLRYTW